MCLPGTLEKVRENDLQLTRRTVLAGGGAAALAALLPGDAEARKRRRRRGDGHGHGGGRGHDRVVDLTHTFTAGFPVYTGETPKRRTLKNYVPDGFYSQEWTFGEHSGTHMDAPGHFVQGGRLTPQLEAHELVLPIVVIDISERAARDPDTEVTPDDLRRFERRHGRIPRGALVAMDSGWAAKLGTPAFTGKDADDVYHFPGFGAEAVEELLDQERAAAIGVDTLSLDNGPSTTFAVHNTWLPADNFGLENLANLDRIPRRGATAVVGVIPWEAGSGGPARVLAMH
jgi:kynurenine formamidase